MSSPPRIGLVGCVKQKQSFPSPARDLYMSTLFVGRRRWVEASCGSWYVLSALHGLIDPDAIVEPYDVTLNGASRATKRGWAQRVLGQLGEALGPLEGPVFEIHAGAEYRDFGLVDGLEAAGAAVVIPALGLRQGEQLAFYAHRNPSHGDGNR